ncbi:MAG: PHP domain-containing protein [Finegoldia sp.]|nr:PHP domain-containing protein [Finegoldia sp.]
MEYRDQHVHTDFSFDSDEKLENYVALVDHELVTTEHMDLESVYADGGDIDIDYDKYVKTIDDFNQNHKQQILKGIEIGYRSKIHKRIEEKLSQRDYDIKLLSVHESDKYSDYMGSQIINYDQREVLEQYYTDIKTAVTNFKDYNILTHIDFAIRRTGFDKANLDLADQALGEIFKELINDEKVLEWNTRSVYQYDNKDYYTFAMKKYLDMGGQLVSVGSDCHKQEIYEYHFKDSFKYLYDMGVRYLAIFEKGKMTTKKLEEMI